MMIQALLAVVLAAGGDDEEGFTPLFNGKDLSGWQYHGATLEGKAETEDKRFGVEDGAIVARAKDAEGKGGIRDLYTTATFGAEFTLMLEFRASEKSDSGVYLKRRQIQIRDFVRRGEQKQLTKFRNDDWNELVITVKKLNKKVSSVECLCNGEKLELNMKIPAKDGPVGLQAEGGKFEFRRVRVKAGE